MLITAILSIAILNVVIAILGLSLYKTKQYIKQLEVDFNSERTKIRKDAQFRSAAVNWGLTIENFAPFIDEFPIAPENVTFLGKPIDYVGYENTDSPTECSVHFIEVKSGRSQLLKHQRNIKKAIQAGRVHWHEVRVASNPKSKK